MRPTSGEGLSVRDRWTVWAFLGLVSVGLWSLGAGARGEVLVWTSVSFALAIVAEGLGAGRETSVLVVDDDAISREVALGQLRALGYHADGVASGAKALAALRRQRYDAVLMDCQMPELDGYETTRRIRQWEDEDRRTVVIAVTANALEEERQRCQSAGMDDCISKPFGNDQLGRLLEGWLRGHGDDGAVDAGSGGSNLEAVANPVHLDPARVEAFYRLGERTGSNVLGEVVEQYLRETPENLSTLRQALEGEDRKKLQRTAHYLGGGSAALGALGLAALCGELERLCQAGDLVGCRQRLDALNAEYSQLAGELEALRQASTPDPG